MTEQYHDHFSKHIIYGVAKRMDRFNSFIPTSPNTTLRRHDNHQSPEEDGEEELNLGLSLGGQFGVDKSHKGLIRSSSVGGAITLTREEEALIRTASLPPETQGKELQRMEAKRKRLEKQTSVKENGSGDNLNLNLDPDFPGNFHLACGNLRGPSESQGKRSFYGVNFESEKTFKGFGSNGEERNPGSIQSVQDAGSCTGIRTAQLSSKRFNTSDLQKKARVNENGIDDMPCVFTIGDGPKGRKVEGILYRYRKGEEVRIMCVCHGSFFTPAEFVNHAGARDVAHPLKRIVINPNG